MPYRPLIRLLGERRSSHRQTQRALPGQFEHLVIGPCLSHATCYLQSEDVHPLKWIHLIGGFLNLSDKSLLIPFLQC